MATELSIALKIGASVGGAVSALRSVLAGTRDLEDLTLDEIERWLNQANRQIKAKYSKV